jgi:riboflavin biosynthesis pyrimidine reductase
MHVLRSSLFDRFAERKAREAERAQIYPLHTVEDRSGGRGLREVGNEWTRQYYDGGFHLFDPPELGPAISLVFVQSREGNTGAANPEDLGGGDTDRHVMYEGLSRVAADAVLAGAKTAEGEVFFSVWHPEIVRLREALGLPRHPAQIVVTGRGCLDVDRTLMFNAAEAPVYVLGSAIACAELAVAASTRSWVHLIPMEDDDVAIGLAHLRDRFGIKRVSAVGGRTTASSLIDAGLVQDLCLTTTSTSGGDPGTPFYVGEARLALDRIVAKRGTEPDAPIRFDHLAISAPSPQSASIPHR